MHNNYYFLKQLSAALQARLKGTIVSECFSQNKDELIIRFETETKPFFVKADLSSSFSSLSFPENFNRAKKNSVDLFESIVGYRVMEFQQFRNERSFAMHLEDGKVLLFKMHGNRSNIILYEESILQTLFKSNLPGDETLVIDSLNRDIDWSVEAFQQKISQPEKLYFTLGKVVWHYLGKFGFQELSPEEKYKHIQNTVRLLEDPEYYSCYINGTLHFSLLPLDDCKRISSDPIKAANTFNQTYNQESGLNNERAKILSSLKTRLTGSENYYEKNFKKLVEIESDTNYKIWADLIMANMHAIKQGVDKVSLADFYKEGQMTEIKLKKDLSPQHNAALFYKKAKNQHIEIERLQQTLTGKQKEIERLKTEITEVENMNDLKSLREKSARIIPSQKEKQPLSLPYHEFTFSGYKIWVGKSARHNDELTLKYSYKDDLWLHAKDVAGSHVLIKCQSGKSIPKEVIERAAELAAYNSKRKTETLCPVVVTPKKFVRKRKGDPAGAVVVEREDVIMVEPKL